jgi:Domain of unknown function (DUF4352)
VGTAKAQIALLLALLYVLVVSGCSVSRGSSSSTTPKLRTNAEASATTVEQTEGTQASQQYLSVGQAAKLPNGLGVTVDGVHSVERSRGGKEPSSGEAWILVSFTIENIGEATIRVTADNFAAANADRLPLHEVPASSMPEESTASKEAWQGDFEPRQKRSGSVAYISGDADSILLAFNRGQEEPPPPPGESRTLAIWDLGEVSQMPRA